jgi:hypothetical protein
MIDALDNTLQQLFMAMIDEITDVDEQDGFEL